MPHIECWENTQYKTTPAAVARRQKRLILPNFEPWRKPWLHVYFRKSWLTMNRPFPPFCGLKPQTLVFFKSKYHIVSKYHTFCSNQSKTICCVKFRQSRSVTRMVGIFCPPIKRLQKVGETLVERIKLHPVDCSAVLGTAVEVKARMKIFPTMACTA